MKDEIFGKDLRWRERILIFTWHFKKEFEMFRKPDEFILDILDHGTHALVSKNRRKYNVLFPYKGRMLCLSYAAHEDAIILIHIKPRR